MDDHLKTYAIWAGLGAALGVGVAVGLGLRALAAGAAVGVGAGAAVGLASSLKRRPGSPVLLAVREPAVY